ncbi:MAG: site specific recombinase, phage integrase family [Verrucomicrobiaceae bacterium]|nr:site specific recombinase, phage integrase family [Verrucomicrobiaceae bacterium]
MNAALRSAPIPIFDNLEYIGNPFQLKPETDAFQLPAHITINGAERDYEFALKFLYSYNGSTATFNAYRRELERLLQWSWHIQELSIAELKREDIEAFIRFCQNPPLTWIGTKNVPRFIDSNGARGPNSEWRPFVASIPKSQFRSGKMADTKQFMPSQAAVKATFTALSSFYDFLLQETVVASNPVALMRQKSKFIQRNQNRDIVRRVSNLQWDYVIETAEMMANATPEAHERTLFIMNCLFAMYLRISELVSDERSTPAMGHFRKDMDGNWWFHVTGKGNKSRTVTVSDEMLKALRRYRHHLGLSPLPTQDEQTPLVQKNLGKGPVTSTRHIRTIVQHCFDAAFERMVADGMGDDAAELRAATVHWLRHTGISEDVKTRPREHVRDDAGHSSMQTTDRYIESDLRERHRSGKGKQIKDL